MRAKASGSYNDRIDKTVGSNINEAAITVRHQDLKRAGRAGDNGIYRSVCPKCKIGILLMRRDQKTGELIEDDHCMLCGQYFIYSDLEDLKRKRKLM